VPGDGGVGTLALSSGNVPGIAHHKFEVIVLVDAGTNIGVVFLKFFESNLAVTLLGVPLGHELVEDVILGHLAGLVLGVEGHVVVHKQVLNVNNSVSSLVQLLEGKADQVLSALGKVSTDTSEELVESDLSVVVLVEVLENAFELGGGESVAVLLETPHELMSVHSLVTVVVHAAEHNSETADAVSTSALESIEDLLEDLVRGLSSDSEAGVDVGVVARSLNGEPVGEFFVVELAVVILVVLAEDGLELVVLEEAADSLESFLELRGLDGAVAIQVEVLEDSTHGLSLVVGTVGALANFLENDVFELGKARSGHVGDVGVNAPSLEDHVDEVVLLLVGEDGVSVGVEAQEAFLADLTTLGVLAHQGDEVIEDGLGLLLAAGHTGVKRGVVLGDEGLEGNGGSSLGEEVEGVLDDSDAVVADLGL